MTIWTPCATYILKGREDENSWKETVPLAVDIDADGIFHLSRECDLTDFGRRGCRVCNDFFKQETVKDKNMNEQEIVKATKRMAKMHMEDKVDALRNSLHDYFPDTILNEISKFSF